MPPLLAASAAVRLAVDGRSGRSAGAAGALFSHTQRSLGSNDRQGVVVHLAHSTGAAGLPAESGDVAPSTESMSLKTVLVFFRHGARTPLKHIPGLKEAVYDKKFLIASVPYTEVPVEVRDLAGGPRPKSELQVHYATVRFKGGVEAGVLTTVGKDQMYLLGKRLAARYGDFAGKEFSPKDVFVRSTNIDRCIQSIQCVLAGLYGHLSFENKDPVLVTVDKLPTEVLIPNSYHCPSFRQLVKNSQALLETDPQYLHLLKAIESHTGVKLDPTEVDMMQMRDHVVARRAHGLPVPDFLDELFPEIDRAAVHVLVSTVCGNIKDNPTLGLSFAIGRLLTKIKDDLMASAAQKVGHLKGPKLLLHSCHDSSVAPLLIAMGCFDNEWPPYAADVAIELYEDTAGQHWVKVKYCEKEMVLKGCKSPLMSLNRFLEVIQPYSITVDQYNVHCNDVVRAVKHINAVVKNQTLAKEEDEDFVTPPNI